MAHGDYHRGDPSGCGGRAMRYATSYLRDRMVRVWDVRRHRFITTNYPSDELLATLPERERLSIMEHCGLRCEVHILDDLVAHVENTTTLESLIVARVGDEWEIRPPGESPGDERIPAMGRGFASGLDAIREARHLLWVIGFGGGPP